MIAANVQPVVSKMLAAEKALDVGGWHKPINAATHVIDILEYATRLNSQAWDPENSPRFNEKTWLQFDICNREPWPFPDKYFDFSVCSHVLEDIRDPIWVVSELARVSKKGYLECPTPASELLSYDGRMVGCQHHRWFVDFQQEPGTVLFRMKPHDLLARKRYVHASRLHTVDWDRLAHGIFWENTIQGREVIFDVGVYIDSILPETQSLVHFAPIKRISDKINRKFFREAVAPTQPAHGTNGVKYPYL